MRETQDQIDQTLELCGETLAFPYGIVMGIPGHQVGNVQSFDSPYDFDMQEFSFQISSKAALATGVSLEDTFQYTLNARDYSFEILSIVDDLLGWFEIRAKLLGVVTNV